MKVSVKVHGAPTPHIFEVHPEFEVISLKALIEDEMGVAMDQQRLLHKGRVLRDEDTLQAAGVGDDAQLYVAQHSGATHDMDASAMVPQPNQEAPSADPMAAMLNSPMMQGMLDNPEMLRTMLQANPQMREVMDNNPELAQMLNDPALLRQSLASARNPQLMREMQRNTDRAMSNIEAHPGGHNMLRRMYQTVQAPLEQASTGTLEGMMGAAGGSNGEGSAGSAGSAAETASNAPPSGPNTTALPNPWATPPQQQMPNFGFGGGGPFGFGGGRGGFGGPFGGGGRGGGGWGGGGRSGGGM